MRRIAAVFAAFAIVFRIVTPDTTLAEEKNARVIEEIVVTAQRTEENVREVPISMSVVTDEFMQQEGITDFQQMSPYIPNAHVDSGLGEFPDINIRGFGTALANKAFEQSVGLAIDGVPYGRSPYFQSALFDLERVEVLRGPQGTLFGKNTTAGLFNVITKKPTDDFTGFVHAEVGDYDRRHFETAIGGPILKHRLDFRISGLTDDRDGIVENTTARFVDDANSRMGDIGRKAVRVQLGLPDVFGASVNLSYEKEHTDDTGPDWEFRVVPEHVRPFYLQFDPDTDFKPGNFIGSVNAPMFDRVDFDTFVGSASYPIGDWKLDALGGYSMMKVKALLDADFGPAPITYATNADDNPQSTFELRATSPSLAGLFGLGRWLPLIPGSSDFLAGFFFQRRKLAQSDLAIFLNLPVLAEFAAFNDSPEGTPLPPIEQFIGAAVPIRNLGVFDTRALMASERDRFDQKSTSFAGFAHANWHLSERWTLESGLRLTEEKKQAHWNRTFSPGSELVFAALGGEQFTTGRQRSEFATTPRVAVKYDWTEDLDVYASWATGFKAGGFNEDAFNTTDEALEYKPEKSTAWETGAKARLLNGAASVNLGLFRETVSDLQVLTLPPNSVATTVVNAGEARSQGVELDSQWLPTSFLSVFGSVGFIDAKYVSFPFGVCAFDKPDTDGNGDGRCDLSGKPLFHTPKWKVTVTPSIRSPLGSVPGIGGMLPKSVSVVDLIGSYTQEYQDVQLLARSDDPRGRQGRFFRSSLHVGFGNPAQGWSVRFNVENLTNQATAAYVIDVPLGGGNFAQIVEPPRLMTGSFHWAF